MKSIILNTLAKFKLSTYVINKRRKVLNYINRYLPGTIYENVKLDRLRHSLVGYDGWIYTSETPQHRTLHFNTDDYDEYLKTHGMKVGYPIHKTNESLIKLSKSLRYLSWPKHERNHILCYCSRKRILVVDGTHRTSILCSNVNATADVKVISTFWLWIFLLLNSKLTPSELVKYK